MDPILIDNYYTKIFSSSKVRLWSWITGIVLVLILFLARFGGLNFVIYKIITPIFLITAFANWKLSLKKLPQEVVVWLAIIIWSLIGIPSIKSQGLFEAGIYSIVQTGILMAAISLITIYTGSFKPAAYGFIVSGLLHLMMGILESGSLSLDSVTRVEGLTGNSNGFAFRMLLSIFSIILLWKSFKKKIVKIGFLGIISFLVYAIVATASRKAYLAVIIFFGLWFLILYREKVKNIFALIIPIFIGGIIVFNVNNYIVGNSNLGSRLQKVDNIEDENRYLLYVDGFEILSRHPLMGVGLGNFKAYSKLGKIAHSDLMEVSADLGLVGLFLYLLFYFKIISKALYISKMSLSNDVKYQMKIIYSILLVYFLIGLGRPHFIDIISMLFLSSIIGYLHHLKIRSNLIVYLSKNQLESKA